MTLGAYRRALDAIMQRLLATLLSLIVQVVGSSRDVEEARRTLTPLLTRELRDRRREAYDLAVEMLRSQAVSHGVADPYVPEPQGYPEESVGTVLREHLRGSPQEAAAAVAGPLVRHVEDAARQTVVRAVEEKPEPPEDGEPEPQRAIAYARVLTGADNCEFCVMLASRGSFYESVESAGRIPASLRWADAKGFVNRYHDNCDCVVVPVYDRSSWPGRDQSAELYRLWRRVTRGLSGRDAMNALARELSRMQREGESLPVQDVRQAA